MKAGIKAPLTQPAINKRSLILNVSPSIGVFLTYKNKDTAPKEMIDKISQVGQYLKTPFRLHQPRYVHKACQCAVANYECEC